MKMYRSGSAVGLLSKRSLRANTSRNIIAVIAVALTALLFTALFTVGSGMVENIQRQTMRQAGGDGMAILKYITDEQYQQVKDHELVDRLSYNRIISDEVICDKLLKRHAEIYYMDDVGIELGFCQPTEGRRPEAENEIMMDTRAMDMLGLPREVGAPVSFTLRIHDGVTVTRDFVLSGWWEADPSFNMASIMVVSKAYIDAHEEELYNSFYENHEMTGVINSYVMFKSSLGLEDKLERLITESGYSMDENSPDYIASNVNWAYLSGNFDLDPTTVTAALAAVGLIVLTGYLIIYNIFQISVIKDIRFYGLLKTIGTTGKQVRGIIRRQALILSLVGIPVGLVLGYFVGVSIVPLIMNRTAYAGGSFETSANPVIFAGSVVFALLTVLMSAAKPGRLAAKVSPIEAVRYTESGGKSKKSRETKKGSRVLAMASANLGRNKKRTLLVVLSMSLSLVLFNTVYTVSLGFDMDKYLSTFVDTDFAFYHANLPNYRYTGENDGVSETMIASVEALEGFENGGRYYCDVRDAECFRVKPSGKESHYLPVNEDDRGNYFCALYGLDDFPLGRLKVLEGEIDLEKLKSGKYILEGVITDDNHNPVRETSHYNIGDAVTLCNYRGLGETADENEYTEYQFKIMAKVESNYFTNTCRSGYDYSYYLPSDVYKTMTADPGLMQYICDFTAETEESAENFLKKYTEEIDPVMAFSSKFSQKGEFEGLRSMVLTVGGSLSLIIGVIGVLNFVNSVLTSILTRRREFAMLRSIGMTARQLRRMLMAEGLMYTASSGLLSIVLGIGLSALLAGTVAKSLWFFTYRFTLLPLAFTIPIFLFLGLILPAAVMRSVEKQSVVERLRESDD